MPESLSGLFFITDICWVIKNFLFDLIRQVLLFHIMFRVIMGIQITNTMSQF